MVNSGYDETCQVLSLRPIPHRVQDQPQSHARAHPNEEQRDDDSHDPPTTAYLSLITSSHLKNVTLSVSEGSLLPK